MFNAARVVLDDLNDPSDTLSKARLIAFQEDVCGDIYLIREDRSKQRVLFNAAYCIADFAWSPDGNYIAYIEHIDNGKSGGNLYVVIWSPGLGQGSGRRHHSAQ